MLFPCVRAAQVWGGAFNTTQSFLVASSAAGAPAKKCCLRPVSRSCCLTLTIPQSECSKEEGRGSKEVVVAGGSAPQRSSSSGHRGSLGGSWRGAVVVVACCFAAPGRPPYLPPVAALLLGVTSSRSTTAGGDGRGGRRRPTLAGGVGPAPGRACMASSDPARFQRGDCASREAAATMRADHTSHIESSTRRLPRCPWRASNALTEYPSRSLDVQAGASAASRPLEALPAAIIMHRDPVPRVSAGRGRRPRK